LADAVGITNGELISRRVVFVAGDLAQGIDALDRATGCVGEALGDMPQCIDILRDQDGAVTGQQFGLGKKKGRVSFQSSLPFTTPFPFSSSSSFPALQP
jgi:hypothetical protein